jgi:hypothetical protein
VCPFGERTKIEILYADVEIDDGKHRMQRMNQESNVPRRFDGMYVFHLCAQI